MLGGDVTAHWGREVLSWDVTKFRGDVTCSVGT